MTSTPLRSDDPRHLGDYRLLARLGEGGMGTVFLAQDPAGRPVAVKMIRTDLSSDPDFRDRFRSEVARARQVPPFCTAEVLDADPDHEPPYLVQEYVDGASLAEVILDRGPLTGGSLHSVAIGVITALAAIHDAGVVHRDLKPGNVLFALGTPKVIDFGLAKAFDTTTRHTGAGQIFGTVEYMAPERFQPDPPVPPGPAADIFAWAVVVAFAATGGTPFAAGDPIATIAAIAQNEPDLADVPEPLRGLLAVALHKDPARRPTAHQLLDRLLKAGAAGDRAVQVGLQQRPELRRAVHAVRNSVTPHPSFGRGHRRDILLVAAAAALVVGIVVAPTGRPKVHAGRPAASPIATSTTIDAVVTRSKPDAASRGDNRYGCTYDGPVPATRQTPAPIFCPDPVDGSADRRITARIQLANPDACAVLSTNVTATSAYEITVCRGRMLLTARDGTNRTDVATSRFKSGLTAQEWTTIEVRAAGATLTASLDGTRARVDRPGSDPLPHGGVILGLAGTVPVGGPPGRPQVIFADVTVERP